MSRKSILLATHHLLNYTGSELVIFDLASELNRQGHDVTVASFIFDHPAKGLFDAQGIRVIDLLSPEPRGKEYDLLWVQHTPVINHLLLSVGISARKIVFSSLSPYDPLEAPPLYANQLSFCLANSPENRDQQLTLGTRAEKLGVFPNSASHDFISAFDPEKSPELKKLAIVSNHIPPEVGAAAELLSAAGLEVDIFGFNGRVEYFDSTLLTQYDALISIGRSIQYGLVAGIPVYCYDHFGGPGWIMPDNLDSAGYHNFSGRCCGRKLTPEAIVREVIDDHSSVFALRSSLRELAIDRYSLEINVSRTLDLLANCPATDIHPADFELIRRSNDAYVRELKNGLFKDSLLRQKDSLLHQKDSLLHQKDSLLQDKDTHIHNQNMSMHAASESLRATNAALEGTRAENSELLARIELFETQVATQEDELDRLRAEVSKLHHDLHHLLTSVSWKITRPLRFVRNSLRQPRI